MLGLVDVSSPGMRQVESRIYGSNIHPFCQQRMHVGVPRRWILQ